jgi:hypothetical protein
MFFDFIFQYLVDFKLILIIYSVCFLRGYHSLEKTSQHLVNAHFCKHLVEFMIQVVNLTD